MADENKHAYRDLDDAALLQELADTKDALFKKRFENATGQLDNVSVLKKLRKDVARINTELRAREIAAARSARDHEGERLMADDTTTRPNARKLREGIVTSAGMDKTAVVTVTTRKPHPLYKKTMVRTKKLYVHDEANDAKLGDKVRVQETRPLSKLKRWRLVEVLERAR